MSVCFRVATESEIDAMAQKSLQIGFNLSH